MRITIKDVFGKETFSTDTDGTEEEICITIIEKLLDKHGDEDEAFRG